MRSPGDHEDVPHTLLPLSLGVGLVRHKAYGDRKLTDQGREGDFNVLARFVADTVPIYEYALDPSRAPRGLRKHELEGGMFRQGGKELHFIDGRAPLRHMAVNATDIECVLSLLLDPERAAQIRSRFLRIRAQKLRARSRRLKAEAELLRREAMGYRTPADSTPTAEAA